MKKGSSRESIWKELLQQNDQNEVQKHMGEWPPIIVVMSR